MLSIANIPETVLKTLDCKTLQEIYEEVVIRYLHFIAEETEALRGWIICKRHSINKWQFCDVNMELVLLNHSSSVALQLHSAHENHQLGLFKHIIILSTNISVLRVSDLVGLAGAWESPFLSSSQEVLMLLVHRSHLENHCSTMFQALSLFKPSLCPLAHYYSKFSAGKLTTSQKKWGSVSQISPISIFPLPSPNSVLSLSSLIISFSSTFVKVCYSRSIFQNVDSIIHTPWGTYLNTCTSMSNKYDLYIIKTQLFCVYSLVPLHLFIQWRSLSPPPPPLWWLT